jgi:membrane associated rhomboid family serine protease
VQLIHSDPPILNAPRAVRWIAGITVLVHIVRMLAPQGFDRDLFAQFAFVPGRYLGNGVYGGDPLAFLVAPVTHLFLHADWMHLIVNMAFFLAFGSAIGRRMGAKQFVVLYLLCGIVAAFSWAWMYGETAAILLGASGAVSGMVGAVARVSIWPPRHSGSALPFWRPQIVITFVVIWLVLNILFGVFPVLISDGYGGIAWEAHLGGFIAGFLLIGFFDGRGRIKRVASSY